MNKKRAVIYARFSSHSQTEQSIEGQLRECYAYAKRNDLVVVHEYIDRAMTGTNDKRPEFLQMIEDSKKKTFNFVLVYQLDRFARNRYDSANNKAKLKKNGVRVLSAKENISDDASGALMESVLEGMAEYYSAELSQKVKRGIHESLLKGNYIGGHILYGYKVVDKKYQIDDTEANIVRQIFSDYANGMKAKEIVDKLKNQAVKSKNNKYFTLNDIAKMLRNAKYIGICELNDEIYDKIYPQIVEENLFKRCNEIMNEHKHRQRKNVESDDIYILSGKLYCGVCGNLMTAETGTSKTGEIHRYYKCFGKKKKSVDCEKRNVRKEVIEDFVFEKTKQYVLQPKVIEQISQVVADKFNSELSQNITLVRLNEDLKNKTKSINAMLDALEQGIITKSTQERLLNLENEKALIEEQIAYEEAHQLKPLDKEQIKAFLNAYVRKDFDSKTDRNDFFNGFISKVILYDNGVTIEYNSGTNTEKEDFDNPNYDGTPIFSEKVEIMPEENKKLPFGFKRQFVGGERAFRYVLDKLIILSFIS